MHLSAEVPLVEPIAVADVFVSGIADIEDLGEGSYRVLLHTMRRNVHDHSQERVVVASLIMSREAIIRCIFDAAKSISLSLVTDLVKMPRDGDRMN